MIQLVCAVLVTVLNILFIYFGIGSGWYYFVDSLGTELKVISIGEGIIAGFLYFIFAIIFLYNVSSGRAGAAWMLTCNSLMVLVSLVLVLTNTCQLGLVSWHVPRTVSAAFPDQEYRAMQKDEWRQVSWLLNLFETLTKVLNV